MQKLLVAALALAAAWLAAKVLARLMRAGLPRQDAGDEPLAGPRARRIPTLREDPKTGVYTLDED